MSLEITLFVNNHFEIRKKDTRQMIGDIIKTVINDELNNKEFIRKGCDSLDVLLK